jgi:hypothetical protein
MTLPKLENWNETASGLHQGARLLGVINQLTQSPQPVYLELPLEVAPKGLSTGRLPAGGRVVLDFLEGSLQYNGKGEAPFSVPLNGCTQAEVFERLFSRLAEVGLSEALPPGENLFERISAAVGAKGGRYRQPQRTALMNEKKIEMNPQTARDYLISLQEIFTGIARFKARLRGMQTPLIVWPHGFDLSTLWFAGSELDEGQFHTNFGFSPRSEGIDYPYLYAYAYPYPPNFQPPALPEGARWHTQGWTGAVLPYEVIAAQPEAAGFVEASCATLYAGLVSAPHS